VNLVVLVLGAFAAAAGVRLMTGTVSWRVALATVAAVLGLVAIVSSGWSHARNILTQRGIDAKTTAAERRASVGQRFGAREDILRVVDEQIPRRAKVLLICPNCSAELGQWITYRLTPRRFTDGPEGAEWIFTYDSTPEKGDVEEDDLVDPRTIAPGFEIARLR
jgi:hypothetical protein